DIPELTVAVLPEHQGQGIGGVLADTVCTLARMSGLPAVSLSVEDGNGAAKLDADHGFLSVGRNGDAELLVRSLTPDWHGGPGLTQLSNRAQGGAAGRAGQELPHGPDCCVRSGQRP